MNRFSVTSVANADPILMARLSRKRIVLPDSVSIVYSMEGL
jgi:hypothetical protein